VRDELVLELSNKYVLHTAKLESALTGLVSAVSDNPEHLKNIEKSLRVSYEELTRQHQEIRALINSKL